MNRERGMFVGSSDELIQAIRELRNDQASDTDVESDSEELIPGMVQPLQATEASAQITVSSDTIYS